MESQDLLSAALNECGLDLNTVSQNVSINQISNQPSTSLNSTSLNLPRPNLITSKDIEPFLLNGKVFYKTPNGVVQVKEKNKICIISPTELNQMVKAEKQEN